MKYIILLVTFALSTFQLQAQGDGSGRVRQMRINFITQKLQLPAQQNSHFWEVYTHYMDERSALRNNYITQFKGSKKELSNYEANRLLDDNIEYKEKDLQLSKKYKEELLKVISAQQLVDLYQAERDFKQMLIKTLKEK